MQTWRSSGTFRSQTETTEETKRMSLARPPEGTHSRTAGLHDSRKVRL